MTDITELTSVQKNANIHRLSRLIAYAPNDELRQMAVEVEHYTDQLIEELEKAQQRIVELDRKNCELDSLTQRWAVERAENADHIAALESRTVKLPEPFELAGLSGGSSYYYADEVDAALTAQGIKWEAE